MMGELQLQGETRRTWAGKGTQLGPEPVWTSLNNCIRKMAFSLESTGQGSPRPKGDFRFRMQMWTRTLARGN